MKTKSAPKKKSPVSKKAPAKKAAKKTAPKAKKVAKVVTHKVGTIVKWDAQGSKREGAIAAVLPAGTCAPEVASSLSQALGVTTRVSSKGNSEGYGIRKEVSYIVIAAPSKKKNAEICWPRTGQLKAK